MMKMRLAALVGFCCSIFSGAALAVSTSHWTHQSEADFKAGTLHNVVVTNLGDVKLSRAVKTIQQEDPNVTTVNCLAAGADGTVYAGTGPKGILLGVKDDKVSTVATLADTVNILCLLSESDGSLVIGTGGAKGKVLKIDKPGDAPHEIFSSDGVQYIWAIVAGDNGTLYAATGPNGQVFEIHPDGTSSELYKGDENNITAMIGDGHDLLYLGTDPSGLVIRLNRKTKESFILYNASESDITALTMDDAGNLYAATGEASEKEGQPATEQSDEKSGRPESNSAMTPIPANPSPEPPKPPEMPNPNPGNPKPIPKNKQSRGISPDESGLPVYMDDPGGDQPGPGGGGGDEPGGGGGTEPSSPLLTTPASDHTGPQPAQPETDNGDQGNAIYKIDPEGFVTEIFRQDVVIYAMLEQNDVLLLGTGGDGELYQVNPTAEETVVLAKVDAKQVMCLLPATDGRIMMGLANTGGISAMTSGYASDGTYISPVLDATQVSRFGNIQLHGQLPDGAGLKVTTRSGNVRDSDSQGWSAWSADVNASEFVKVAAPSARFLQYRLTFSTTDPAKTSLVDFVDVTYQMPNLAPVIKSIKLGGEGDSGAVPPPPAGVPAVAAAKAAAAGTGTQTITWEASDPNNDNLVYTLYFRQEQSGVWILLKDKLKDTSYEWDTRNVADGRYQVKVVASDALSNPPGQGKTATRVSDSIVVDNTPPTIGDVVLQVTGKDAQISLRAQDQTSTIAGVEYSVDSSDEWQTVLPVDGIFDSPSESVVLNIKDLTAGQHQVTIRATDSSGNQAMQSLVVNVNGN
jgi:hypothetical protein